MNSSPERNKKINEYMEALTEEDWELLAEFEEEQSRKGHFTRIFPLASNVDYYNKFFEANRHANQLIWQYLKLGSPTNILKHHFKW